MISQKNNHNFLKPRILVSPLEWGLGHATRCIPIIKELLVNQCDVFIAAEGATYSLLKNEFPQLNFIELAGYRVKLTSQKNFFTWKMMIQFPKILYAIYYEHQWFKKIIKQYKITAVISDNRIGLYNNKIYSIYITHQLFIKTNNSFTSNISSGIHRFFIKKFNECWVPDFEKAGLAGDLSHPMHFLKNVKYIGALSRFERMENIKRKYDLLILLSGPEPQRTILEKLILNNLKKYTGKTLLVRGLPANTNVIQFEEDSVEIVNHLSAEKLAETIQQADIIITRSGYTTVMDLIKLNKKAILIPTPGQGEQEYLARYLNDKKYFFYVDQQKFNLTETPENFKNFSSVIPNFDMEQYKVVIKKFAELMTKLISP